jgi:hypothetical protein
VKTKPFLKKVFSIHGAISFWVLPDKEKGWQVGNPSYKKEPKIKISIGRGMTSIGLQS